MNNKRRKQIEEIKDEISAIKIRLEEIKSNADGVLNEDRESLSVFEICDIYSASECIEDACDSLESAYYSLEDFLL